MSYKTPEDRRFWSDKAFKGVRSGEREQTFFLNFLESQDFRPNTLKAIANDLRRFMLWFNQRNGEAFVLERVTVRDVTDFRNYIRIEKGLAVATVNRAVTLLRRFFGWLVERGELKADPAKPVKQLLQVDGETVP